MTNTQIQIITSLLLVDCVVQHPVTQHHLDRETAVMPGTCGRMTLTSQNHSDSHITSIHTMSILIV